MKIWTLALVLTIARKGICESPNQVEGAHVVQIGQKLWNGKVEFICGGSYLGDKIVVLGAHCFNKKGLEPNTVRFGNGAGRSFDVGITNFTIHYRYKPQYDYHNMAIAFLDRNPQTVSSGIKPACVMKSHAKPNTPVQLIGPVGNQLKRTSLLAVGSEKCHEFYNPNFKLRFGVLLCCFCARNANASQCTNQHSSPLQVIVKNAGKTVPFLIGHKSIGKSCGTGTPAIYTRYGSYYEWIETVAGIKLNGRECFSRY